MVLTDLDPLSLPVSRAAHARRLRPEAGAAEQSLTAVFKEVPGKSP